MTADGLVHDKNVIPTPPNDSDALARAMRALLADAKGPVAGAVVGVPGSVDYSSGEVLRLPNLPGWEGPIGAGPLGKELGLPVLLANDADLAALGEHRFGAGRDSSDMVYITCSTGVGAGVILDGLLVHGRFSLAEIGHTIIDRTSHETVETLGSGTALTRLAGEDASAVAARARAGDPDARRQFAAVAKDFAIGVFNLVHCYSPETVVIGGGMSEAGDLLLGPVRTMLGRCSADCPGSRVNVVRADGGDDVGLRGAAAYWADSQAS